jgi:hypothetical protein
VSDIGSFRYRGNEKGEILCFYFALIVVLQLSFVTVTPLAATFKSGYRLRMTIKKQGIPLKVILSNVTPCPRDSSM